jgi:hypothetical protein
VVVDDEDKAIILLCSLLSSYEHVVMTSTFAKESIKIGDITAACYWLGNKEKEQCSGWTSR